MTDACKAPTLHSAIQRKMKHGIVMPGTPYHGCRLPSKKVAAVEHAMQGSITWTRPKRLAAFCVRRVPTIVARLKPDMITCTAAGDTCPSVWKKIGKNFIVIPAPRPMMRSLANITGTTVVGVTRPKQPFFPVGKLSPPSSSSASSLRWAASLSVPRALLSSINQAGTFDIRPIASPAMMTDFIDAGVQLLPSYKSMAVPSRGPTTLATSYTIVLNVSTSLRRPAGVESSINAVRGPYMAPSTTPSRDNAMQISTYACCDLSSAMATAAIRHPALNTAMQHPNLMQARRDHLSARWPKGRALAIVAMPCKPSA
mmetsp:Transcript_76390/g.224075  ORF Transcript_76390/g.224075 Transcript_76390/m.224075 type:complete len:313 (+) Transcript_76390:441-1379(+)